MNEHFNGLNPAEDERLALLMEEMAEVQQVIGKILRHGYESYHPNGGPNNRELLERELGDVRCALHMMVMAGDLHATSIAEHARDKAKRVAKYLHHQEGADA